jgi:hypothetical protein
MERVSQVNNGHQSSVHDLESVRSLGGVLGDGSFVWLE